MNGFNIPPLPWPESELESRFEALQRRLVPLWHTIAGLSDDPQTIVVVPSLTVDFFLDGALLQAYEERFLFLLLLLRQPNARLVFVTSQDVRANLVDYYLGLLPGVISSRARKRLFFLSPQDGSADPLGAKILKRPRLIRKIRQLIPDPHQAHMVPFISTSVERHLALRLGIPLFGADPKFLRYGTKSGCRELFTECGVSHPAGFENLQNRDDVIRSAIELHAKRPNTAELMVKLNDGVAGNGNAVMSLNDLGKSPGREQFAARVDSMVLEDAKLGHEGFWEKFDEIGGIVEERIQGVNFQSPSTQLRVTPLGGVELISTHDQLLSGPTGQQFTGCLFPANKAYAQQITEQAIRVGQRLAEERVLGWFAIDFVTAETAPGKLEVFAIELNLRKGGTTHPFLTLQFLTDGTYDPERAEFLSPNGETKCYVATDNLVSPKYRAFTPDDVFDLAIRHKLHFDQTRQSGVVFHMLTSLGEYGRLGLTAVGNTHAEAQDFYDRTVVVLDAEAKYALGPGPMPART